jgi:predicted nucleotidyltransferase
MTQCAWFSCPIDIRREAISLIDELHLLLGPMLTGVYLHGSLAMGCLHPHCSDLDVLVLSQRPCPLEAKRHLAVSLLGLSRCPAPIELTLLSGSDLDPWRFPTPYQFHFSEEHRSTIQDDLATGRWNDRDSAKLLDADLAAHITLTRQRGICLWGSPIADVFPEVPETDFRSSILADFRWARQRLTEFPVYGVLNMCRVAAYLREAKLLSKQEAGEWGLRVLPDQQAFVVQAALEGYSGYGSISGVNPEDLMAFAAFMDLEVEAAGSQAGG